MFRQFQLKMTLYYAGILSVIILSINFFTYISLSAFNENQLKQETAQLFNTIVETDWVLIDEVETPTTVPTDPAEPVEPVYEDNETESFEEEEEEDKDEQSEEKEDSTRASGGASGNTILNPLNAIYSTQPPVIITPTLIKSFSFYYIYNADGQLLKYNVANPELHQQLLNIYPMIETNSNVVSRKIESTTTLHYMTLKAPIMYQGAQIGTVFVGRDISVAYETASRLLMISLISSVIGILLSLVLGYLLAGKSVEPIRDAYASKQRFIADASHELRTPISVLNLSTEVLKREITADHILSHQIVGDMKEEIDKMSGLVENLLFLARSDSGRLNLKNDLFTWNQLIPPVVDSLKILVQNKNQTLSVSDLPPVQMKGDLKLLQSLLTLLIENAIKYTPEAGSITIKVQSALKKRIHYQEIIISDTGIGIDATQLSSIFKRFYRVENSRSAETGGHGLGLSIAYEIVQLHKGTIEVDSKLNQGTTFKVYLPVSYKH